jgi:hypothetical protein
LLHGREQQARRNAALVLQCALRCKEARCEHTRLRLLQAAGAAAPEAQDPITFSRAGSSGRGWARGAERSVSAAASNRNPLLRDPSLGVPPGPNLQSSPPSAGASGNRFIRRPSAAAALLSRTQSAPQCQLATQCLSSVTSETAMPRVAHGVAPSYPLPLVQSSAQRPLSERRRQSLSQWRATFTGGKESARWSERESAVKFHWSERERALLAQTPNLVFRDPSLGPWVCQP